MTARAIIAAILSAVALAGCGNITGGQRRAAAPVVYTAPVPMDYDLSPMVSTLYGTAQEVRAAPYAAWKQHSDAVAANNARQWINQGPRICGPLYGSSDVYCH